jgi:hypothetical protein
VLVKLLLFYAIFGKKMFLLYVIFSDMISEIHILTIFAVADLQDSGSLQSISMFMTCVRTNIHVPNSTGSLWSSNSMSHCYIYLFG